MLNELGSIRLKDLEIFLEVARARSIREAARRTRATSGQVSKTIQALEARLKIKLFRRSVSGVLLTREGTELKDLVADLVASGEKIERALSGREDNALGRLLAIGGTAFLNTYLVTPTVCAIAGEFTNTSFRFLDVAPDQLVTLGLRGGYDLAVHFGKLQWPGTWTSRRLGKTRWALCARADHPLGKRATLRQTLEYAFVTPTYWTQEGLVRGNDQFPLPLTKRKPGFETATADAAIPILLNSDQLAYLPEILARGFLGAGQLQEIQPLDLQRVERELFLSAKADSVPAKMFEKLAARMSAEL